MRRLLREREQRLIRIKFKTKLVHILREIQGLHVFV